MKYMEVICMMFEDRFGNLLMPDEVEGLALWEIEEKGIHVLSDVQSPEFW